MKSKLSQLPLLIIVVGIVFTLYLQWRIPDGIFFSGDAGLKALLAQQLGSGQLRFDLIPPLENWVRNLRDSGLYPYAEPFVYQQNDRYFITFPFTFPLVTAPFYALFGFRGLYFIPLVATWFTWGIFYAICQRLKLKSVYTSLVLIGLIFAAPLTMYSAMYWEHSLAVALAFTGVSMLLVPVKSSGLRAGEALISGCLLGLAVWFRPEFLCLVAIVIGLVYTVSLSRLAVWKTITDRLGFQKIEYLSHNQNILVVSTIVTIAIFFFCNKLIYNHYLGIHALQVVEKLSFSVRLIAAWQNLQGLIVAFFEYFSLAYFPLLYLIVALISPQIFKPNLAMIIYVAICFLFIVGVALIVPVGTAGLIAGGKQWGPRFLLILIPLVLLLILQQLQAVEQSHNSLVKYTSILLITTLCIIGVHKNIYKGTLYLEKNNQATALAIELLRDRQVNVIGVSHQFVAQVFEPAVQDKFFFKVKERQDLEKLSRSLVAQRENRFIYICYPHRSCPLPKENSDNLRFNNLQLQLSYLGKFGKYPFYEGVILERR